MKDALFLRDEQIKDIIELILFAYRDTFLDSKNILKKHSYGTAHHKALHLIEKHKGISVNGLLSKLKVTKQSLNRVLKDLERRKIIYLLLSIVGRIYCVISVVLHYFYFWNITRKIDQRNI